MDRFPGENYPGTPRREQRMEMVKRLLDAGWGHRVMLSHDWSAALTAGNAEIRAERDQRNPDRYLFITRKVLPRLRELGATEAAIREMTVDNPRRFFEGE